MNRVRRYSDPAMDGDHGPDQIAWRPFAAGTVFRRNFGRAVDKHHYYEAGKSNSSNLAGFLALSDDVGIAGAQIPSVAAGDLLPMHKDLQKVMLFPTSGGVVATEAQNVGKDYDLYVDAAGRQYVNLGSSTHGVLRVDRIVSTDGTVVACKMPPDLVYGN